MGIVSAVNLPMGAVPNYDKAAEQAGLSWPLPEGISGDILHARLHGQAVVGFHQTNSHCHGQAIIHQQLKRKAPTQLQWKEYCATYVW